MATIPKIPIRDNVILPSGRILTDTAKTIINSRKDDNKKVSASVPTTKILGDLYKTNLPAPATSFDAFIKKLQRKAVENIELANEYLSTVGGKFVDRPTGSAFNNCNGKWTEIGYAIYAWNSLASINRDAQARANGGKYQVYIYVKLPNRRSANEDWTQLLKENIVTALTKYPENMGRKINNQSSSNYQRRFELISSNPDAVILKFDNENADALWVTTKITTFNPYTDISGINDDVVGSLDSLFEKFKGQILPSANLQCFMSIKRSIRPDRRYQWVHEGDHVKTILQWIHEFNSFSPLDPNLDYKDLNGKFFAIVLSCISDEDRKAMDTGLAGSIVSPSLQPIWAVDKLFECLKFNEVEGQIKEILNFK